MRSDLGIPEHSRACLFDLDGVLTQTAVVHAAAWKEMFDGFLRQWGERTGQRLAPFDAVADYDNYVDGKPRADGTRSFLESRGIKLPEGSAVERAGEADQSGAGQPEERDSAAPDRRGWRQAVPRLGALPARGHRGRVRRAVVTSSANCVSVLALAGLAGMFDAIVDGVEAAQQHLAGKPAPDTYLAAARAVGVPPGRRRGLRGRAGWGGRGAGRAVRFRGRRGPGRPGRRAARVRRRCGGR